MCRCVVRKPAAKRSRESWRRDIEVKVRKSLLRELLVEKDMTAADLARAAELGPQTVHMLVTSGSWGRSTCSLDTAVRIAGALGVALEPLFVPKVSAVRSGRGAGPQKVAA